MTPQAGDDHRRLPPPPAVAPPGAHGRRRRREDASAAPAPADAGELRGAWAGLADAATAVLIGRRTDPLRGLPEGQAARIRAAQVASVVRLTPLSMSVNLLNTALVTLVFWSGGPQWLLGAWLAVVALLAGAAVRSWHVGKRRPQREAVSRRALARTLAHGAVFAAVWGIAPAALFPSAEPFERFVLGCLATGMIAGGAFALSGVPKAGLAYSWILCLMTAFGMAASGEAAMAAAAAVMCFYATIISRNLVVHGDLFAAHLKVRSEIEAQQELLGLLLRDFEESAGDCLWETDAAGRLRRCPPRFARMLGLHPDTAAGANLPERLNRGTPGGDGGPAARFAARKAFRDLVAPVAAAAGGEERLLSLTAKPILDRAGAFAGFRGVASDVTERVRAEADLARTRAFLDAVVENVPAVLFAKDMHDGGRYVLLNRAGERLLGCSRNAVVGKTDRDLFTPEEAACFATNDQRAIGAAAAAADGAARCVLEEAALTAKDGGVRHLRTRKLVLANGAPEAGPARYLLGISEDVTEQKRDEERLREQHRRLDAALAHMSHGLAMFDAERRLVVCNRRFLEMYGLPDELGACGTPMRALIEASVARGNHPGLAAEGIVAEYEARLSGGEPGMTRVRLADGRIFALFYRPMAGGGSVATFEDITENRRSEALIKEQNERLREREEELAVQNGRFQTAIENMSQGLCFFDGDQRLIVCNTRYAELYGLQPDQVRPGTTLRAILAHRAASGTVPKAAREDYLGWADAVVSAPAASDALIELADGRTVAIHTQPMPDGGWVGTHEDVTERLRTEALVKEQNERLRQREEELAVQNGRFHTALENIGQGLCFFDGDERLIVCNKRFAELYGLAPEQVAPGTTLPEIVRNRVAAGTGPKGMSAENYLDWRGAVAVAPGASATRAELADGRMIEIQHEPMPDGGWVATHEDVTERLRTEAALVAQNERFDAAIANMSHGLAMFDADTRLLVFNERALKLFGLPSDTVWLGRTHREIVECIAALGGYAAGPSPDEICENFRESREDDTVSAVQYRAMANGRTLACATRPMAGGGYVATFEDVTERRQAEARIMHMARHDALTGLPNRLFFHERLTRLLRPAEHQPKTGSGSEAVAAESGPDADRGGGVAVLWIDLDRFKAVNDTLGHPAGDALLKAVAGRIATATRARGGCDTGTTVARLGGDEFAVAMPVGNGPAARADAAALAARLVHVLNEPFELDGHQVVAGASVGIALAPDDGLCPDRLLKAADLALYRAKAEGRSTFRSFEPEMDRHAQARRAMEIDLRRALAAGEFEVHYQPLVNLRTDRVSGFEALLRWNHPERGRVSPAEFVPVAEEIGLIVPIGDWVLRTACAEAAIWPGHLKVAVNLSPAQFKSRKLVASVAEALGASRLPPNRLELEITETVLLECSEGNADQLHHLRALGARIAMDDFGTGYSSLSYLRSFPFDKIKIDRSFVHDLEGDGEGGCAAIIRAVAGLGASLGMSTTAEGIETAAQLAFVRAEGCTEVQGYHLSPPRPAAEIRGMLRSIGCAAREVAAEAL